jgi:hypothetical protein
MSTQAEKPEESPVDPLVAAFVMAAHNLAGAYLRGEEPRIDTCSS